MRPTLRRAIPGIAALGAALALGFAVQSCTPRDRTGEATWRRPTQVSPGGAARQLLFRPLTPGAVRYNEPASSPAPRTPLSLKVRDAVSRVSKELSRPVPMPDPRLYRAVEELALAAPADGPLPYRMVEFAMQRQGIIEPSPHLVVIWGPDDDGEALSERLEERLPEILAAAPFSRLGVGSVHRKDVGETITIVAFQVSSVRTEPIPRALPRGGNFDIQGVVDAGFRNPIVFVTRDDGKVEKAPMVTRGKGRFRASVACGERRGRQQIEITALDGGGSTVLANFPVWCFEYPPNELVVPAVADEQEIKTPEQAEALLAELVNRDREAHQLGPLELDPDLSRVARAHSREMHSTGVVAHVSPTTGTAADRVRRAALPATVVLENVARAYGVTEAEEGLMNSPGHRANILSADATHFGIGVVFGDDVAGQRELFVTQLFVKPPEKIDLRTARLRAERKLNLSRTLSSHGDLSEVAQRFANKIAGGVATAEASAESASELKARRTGFTRVTTLVTTVAEIGSFDPSNTLRDKRITHYGIGIARGDHREIGKGALFVVVLFGHQ